MSISGAERRRSGSCPGRAAGAAPVISFSAMVAAHSTEGRGLRPAAWLAEVLLVTALAATPAIAAPATAAVPAADVAKPSAYWKQIEGRIESGYFQQDTASLVALAATLSPRADAAGGKDGNDEEWRSYYAALTA